MMFTCADAASCLSRVRAPSKPLRAPRRGPLDDLADHAAAYARDPDTYALSAIAQGATPEQQARVLLVLLKSSRKGLGLATRAILERVTHLLCAALPADVVLTTFLALRRLRANHKHTTRTVVRWLLDHPCAEEMAARRSAAVRDALEHALGRDVARGCARRIADGVVADPYLRDHLHRWTRHPPRARAIVRRLYGAPPSGVVLRGRSPAYAAYHAPWAAALAPETPQRPKTVTATNRGDVAATLVHVYRGGDGLELRSALDGFVARAASRLPRLRATVGLVLDASASMAGYGERAFASISQAMALRLVLERCVDELRVIQVGGVGDPPVPEGQSDLALAVLELLDPPAGAASYRTPPARRAPDVVLVVTDGYENRHDGDLARVLEALGPDGSRVIVCICKFTAKDDLSLRRPLRALDGASPVEVWHEDDFADVLLALAAHARDDRGVPLVRALLAERLHALEMESPSWMSLPPAP